MLRILLPQIVSDGRLDWAYAIFQSLRRQSVVHFDWSRVQSITPAGHAVLACLADATFEQGVQSKHTGIPRELKHWPSVRHFTQKELKETFSDPAIQNIETADFILCGNSTAQDMRFLESLESKFVHRLSEDIFFAAKLIATELMNNVLSHAGAERYYLYAGLWEGEFHLGVLDMGLSIPAKLAQKYSYPSHLAALELALKKGISTRRLRVGGFGLFYVYDFLKECEGKLTLISGKAQIRRYFKTGRSQRNELKHLLPGTWCFARFPLEGKK